MADRDLLPTAVERFVATVERDDLRLHGLHVRRCGREPVSHRWSRDERRDVYSVSKTYTSVAVGMARAEGLLELDDPVLVHLPDLADTVAAGADAMTVRHLLTMTHGNELRWEDEDLAFDGDPARAFLAAPLVAPPGTRYTGSRRGASTLTTPSTGCTGGRAPVTAPGGWTASTASSSLCCPRMKPS